MRGWWHDGELTGRLKRREPKAGSLDHSVLTSNMNEHSLPSVKASSIFCVGLPSYLPSTHPIPLGTLPLTSFQDYTSTMPFIPSDIKSKYDEIYCDCDCPSQTAFVAHLESAYYTCYMLHLQRNSSRSRNSNSGSRCNKQRNEAILITGQRSL